MAQRRAGRGGPSRMGGSAKLTRLPFCRVTMPPQSRPETPHGLGRAVRSVAGRDAIYPAAWHPSGTCFAVPSKQQPVALHSLCAVSPGEPGGVRAADDAQAKVRLAYHWRAWAVHRRVVSAFSPGGRQKLPGCETAALRARNGSPSPHPPSRPLLPPPARPWQPVAVYVPFSDGDTLADVRCLAFLCGGARLLGAGPGGVHVFDVSRPGRPIAHRPLVSRRRGRSGGVAPLAIAASPDGSGLYACGSQDCTVGLFDHRSGDLVATLAGHRGGVNHLTFSPDGRLLATGARKDDAVLVWDLRRPPPQAPHAGASPAASSGRDRPRARATAAADIGVLLRLGRPASTHQRTSFCFDSSSSLLLAGTTVSSRLAERPCLCPGLRRSQLRPCARRLRGSVLYRLGLPGALICPAPCASAATAPLAMSRPCRPERAHRVPSSRRKPSRSRLSSCPGARC